MQRFMCMKGNFTLLIIFGKQERAAFEERHQEFSPYICDYYNNSKTYHDDTYVDSLIKMLNIKKKPNRKKEDLSGAVLGKCGNRCDKCLLNVKNSTRENRLLFQKGDYKCYHSSDEAETDYSKVKCHGCYNTCNAAKCCALCGYQSCMECDYEKCSVHTNNFTNPGRCNVGISNQDIELFVLPYCGKERFKAIKNNDVKNNIK